ncbi:MAG: DUF5131 family protein, partial [Candidatus Tectomicrobia bacterium]|nr:DUF5131 family protein [Candidatus Tectomicrobia bacterium]
MTEQTGKKLLKDILEHLGRQPVLFGLGQEEKLKLVEKMLIEGKSWDEIGKAIGWDGPTAKEHYEWEEPLKPKGGLEKPLFADTIWDPEAALLEALSWQEPKKIFVSPDLFHPSLPFEFVDQVLAVTVLSQMHTYLILTENMPVMRDYFLSKFRWGKILQATKTLHPGMLREVSNWPFPNVWLGASIKSQEQNDRISDFLDVQARVKWVRVTLACPLNLEPFLYTINWVVCGGQTGPEAKPCHPGWVRKLKNQCQQANIPFFFEGFGEWLPSGFKGVDASLKTDWGTLDIHGNFWPETTPWNGHQDQEPDFEHVMVRVKDECREMDGQIW